jgi:hypothetical protein
MLAWAKGWRARETAVIVDESAATGGDDPYLKVRAAK